MLANIHKMLKSQNTIWIDAGTSKNRRLINVTKMYEKLGLKVCKALPGLHSVTGCDNNPAFFFKGKKPLDLLMSNLTYIDLFIDLGNIQNFYNINYNHL